MKINKYVLPAHGINPVIHLALVAADLSPERLIRGMSADHIKKAHYLSARDPQPRPLALISGPAVEEDCGFWEIDPQLMPGLYALQIPPSLRSSGYTYVHLKFQMAQPQYLVIQGVDFDPYDSFALGLTTWIRSNCHENLTSGLRRSMPATLRPLLEDWFNRD